MNLLKLIFGKKTARGRLNYETLKVVEEKWPGIEEGLKIGKPSNLKQAVIDADKLVDFVLRQLYPETETMGDRLKLVKERFMSNKIAYDDLWYAHKIRNELVHNPNFNLPTFEVTSLIEKFKVGMGILGVRV